MTALLDNRFIKVQLIYQWAMILERKVLAQIGFGFYDRLLST